MNISNTTTIEDINEEKFFLIRPAFILVSILMPIGIIDNAIALYIYGFRMRKLPVHVFLISLGVFDLIGCLSGIPLELVAMWHSMMYPNRWICKLEKFSIFYSSITSSITLFVIALERYNKVCRYKYRQLTVREAKIIATIIGFLSMALAMPGAMFFDIKSVTVKHTLTHQCLYNFGYQPLQIYFLISLVNMLVILSIMFFLYRRIWKVAREHYTPSNYAANININFNVRDKNYRKSHKKILQTNKILLSITLLFAISFIPGLLLGVTYPLYADVKLPVIVESLRQMIFRMWTFNCTMNPIVYGLFNVRFRHIALSMLPGCFHRKVSELDKPSSSDATK
ncbi:neuropeptide Y receptor type 2-like [Argonauta hians]